MIKGYKETALGIIPHEWDVIKIQDLIETKRIIGHLDGNHGELYPKADEFVLEGTPYIGANNFKSGKVDFNSCKRLSIERSLKFKKGVARNGDVLFAHNATVGPVAYLETDLDFVILSTTATYFRLDNKTINAKYWLNYLDSPFFKNQYIKVMGQSTRNQVPITMQRSFFAILPQYAEQQKIAEILSTVDDKIEVIDQQIIETHALKKGLMQRLLTKGIGHTEFKDSPLGMIPKSWEIVSISEIANIKGRIGYRGYTKEDIVDKGQGAISTSPSNIKDNKLSFNKNTYISWFKYEESPEIQLTKDDILLVKTGSSFGKVAIVDELLEKATINPQLVVLKATKCHPHFLFYLLADNAVQKQIVSTIVGGAIPTLSQKNMLEFQIPMPPLNEQEKIAHVFISIDDKLTILSEKKKHYQELKLGLMQQLLTGKIRVKV